MVYHISVKKDNTNDMPYMGIEFYKMPYTQKPKGESK